MIPDSLFSVSKRQGSIEKTLHRYGVMNEEEIFVRTIRKQKIHDERSLFKSYSKFRIFILDHISFHNSLA